MPNSGCLGFLLKLLNPDSSDGEAEQPWPFRKKGYLLSKAEFSFYRALQQAVADDYVICPKVGLGDLLYVAKGTENSRGWRNKIDRKHADFVLCSVDQLSPVLVVELDDRSHQSASAGA